MAESAPDGGSDGFGYTAKVSREVGVHGRAILSVVAAPAGDGATLAVEVVEESGATLVFGEVLRIVDDDVVGVAANASGVSALLNSRKSGVEGVNDLTGFQ